MVRTKTTSTGTGYAPIIYNTETEELASGADLFSYSTSDGSITALKKCKISVSAGLYNNQSGFPPSIITIHQGDTSDENIIARQASSGGDFNIINVSVTTLLDAGQKLYIRSYTATAGSVNENGTKLLILAEGR